MGDPCFLQTYSIAPMGDDVSPLFFCAGISFFSGEKVLFFHVPFISDLPLSKTPFFRTIVTSCLTMPSFGFDSRICYFFPAEVVCCESVPSRSQPRS